MLETLLYVHHNHYQLIYLNSTVEHFKINNVQV